MSVEPPTVPGFQLERLLGAGAYGKVYLAREEQGLRRPVALKLFANDDAGAFERELAVLETVEELRRRGRHPGIVQALGSGVHEGRGWLALEFLERGSLADRVRASGPLEWREALDAVEQAALGLAVLHRAGLFHRDVKPANLLVGSDGKVRLSDFGLARELDGTLSAAGSPAFAAPEVIAGEIAPDQGARVDVYGLGATLAFLLTGSPARPGRPDAFALERAGSPRPLCEVVLTAMAYEPADRPADAEELVAAIKRVKKNSRTSSGGLEEATKEDEPMTKTLTKNQIHAPTHVAVNEDLGLAVRSDRCPYCHDEVSPSDQDKRACQSCMAWHHESCLREHGACATCGVAQHEEERALAGAYQSLFQVLSAVFVAIGLAAGGLVGWWTQQTTLAGVLTLVGAIAGLLLAHLVSARVVGPARHSELTTVEGEERPPAPRWWRLIKGLPNSFYFLGWGNLGVTIGLFAGVAARSALGTVLGIFLGGLCGAIVYLVRTDAKLRAEDRAAQEAADEAAS